MPQNRKKILIFGYFGFGNTGDELILLSLVTHLKTNAEITVLSQKPAETAAEFSVKAVNRWNPFVLLREIFRAGTVVGGGGGLFQNKTSTSSLFYYLLIILLAKTIRRRVVLLSQGIGPVFGKLSRFFSGKIIGLADIITVRDYGSYEELKKFGLKKEPLLTADAVLALDFSAFKNGKAGGTKVGLALRKFDNYTHLLEEINKVCRDLEKSEKMGFIVFPFHLPGDNILGGEVRTPARPEEFLREFSSLELVVGARFHSLLLAYALGKPFIGLNVDTKIKYFCETHNMPCLELNNINFKENLKSSIIEMKGKKPDFTPEADRKRVQDSFLLVFAPEFKKKD